MKLIKLGLISVLVFALILTGISLLIPSTVRISRAVNIESADVAKTIADLHTWPQWNEMYSDNADVRIVSVQPGEIRTEWVYRNNHVPGNFRIEEASGVSVVQWYFDFRLGRSPWKKFGSILFDKQFGPPMERSLNNLKKLVENSR